MVNMAKQFRNLKEKMTPESRDRAREKTERLLKEMSYRGSGADHDTEGSLRVNEHEEGGVSEPGPETTK
jgi:hypothetical protein